jgi:hypothetical protein
LSFEIDTFLALEPPHYRIDADYGRRKPVYTKTQLWCSGQLLETRAQLLMLQGPMVNSERTFPERTFPELALFNCASCHDSSMHRLEWTPRQLTDGAGPGTVPVNDANLRMSWVIARTISAGDGETVKVLAQTLQKNAAEDRHLIATTSAQLRSALAEVLARVEERGPIQTRVLLDNVIQAGIEGEYRDYLGAEQAVMAIDLLMIDANLAGKYTAQRDELYRLLRSDETYRAASFIDALKALRDSLK